MNRSDNQPETPKGAAAPGPDSAGTPPAWSRVLIGVFVAIFLGLPVAERIAALRDGRADNDAAPGVELLRDAAGGIRDLPARGLGAVNAELVRAVSRAEERANDSLPNALAGPAVRAALAGYLKTGVGDVCVGSDGWLFHRADVEHVTGAPFLSPVTIAARKRLTPTPEDPPEGDAASSIIDFARQLEYYGIRLVVLPVPAKVSVHPARLSARYAKGSPRIPVNLSFGVFSEALRCNCGDFELADPTMFFSRRATILKSPQYQARGSYWLPDAMEAVVASVADAIRPRLEGVPTDPDRLRAEPVDVSGTGELVRLLGMPEGRTAFPPETVTVRRVTDATGAPWQPDPSSPVLVLGDDTVGVYSDPAYGWGDSAGFAEQLSLALGLPVDTIVTKGDGARAPREELIRDLAQGTPRLSGKRVLIWVFAARELSFGDWKFLQLPPPPPGTERAPARLPEPDGQ